MDAAKSNDAEELSYVGLKVPGELLAGMHRRMKDQHFTTLSEYLRNLIRQDVAEKEAELQVEGGAR